MSDRGEHPSERSERAGWHSGWLSAGAQAPTKRGEVPT
jgi:hypothetical protein